MPRPRNPETERWYFDRAVSWRKVYGSCSSLEDVVKTDTATHRWCATVKNYAESKHVDTEWFRCEVDKIRLVRAQLVKEIIDLVRSGTPYHKIMRMVSEQVVLETLVVTHGSQKEAARMLGIDRATVRKYSGVAPVKHEKPDTPVKLEPTPRGWRRGLGFAPKTRGRVEAELTDGTVVIGKSRDLDWSLIVNWRRYK